MFVEVIVIWGDWIVVVGKNDDIWNWIGDEMWVIDLGGNMIVFGFIELYGYFFGLGVLLMEFNFINVMSWGEIVELVENVVKEVELGEWIIGWGWY